MEILEAELRESASNNGLTSAEGDSVSLQIALAHEVFSSQENSTVSLLQQLNVTVSKLLLDILVYIHHPYQSPVLQLLTRYVSGED